MKFNSTKTAESKIILANDHYIAMSYDCSNIDADEEGIIKAGTIIPGNDNTAIGVLLDDVDKNSNPNGAVVIHGFIKKDKIPVAPNTAAVTALNLIKFI